MKLPRSDHFRALFKGYPFTRELILKESQKDIPPLLRGEIWAALLNVKANYKRHYMRIDKYTPTNTDRQVYFIQFGHYSRL